MSGPFFMDDVPAAPARYPRTPAPGKRATSQAAAEAMVPHAATLQDLALKALRRKPQTSWELAQALRVDFESIQPRTSELAALGLIEDSGERGAARSPKRTAIRWRLTAKAAAA
jgi:predicted ArsR family transcriptional regulator